MKGQNAAEMAHGLEPPRPSNAAARAMGCVDSIFSSIASPIRTLAVGQRAAGGTARVKGEVGSGTKIKRGPFEAVEAMARLAEPKLWLTLDVIDSQTHAAYYKFTVMHELRQYLVMLLNHQCSSGDGNCLDCQNLQRIYQFMQTDLFSTVVYTETRLLPRRPSRSQSQPAI